MECRRSYLRSRNGKMRSSCQSCFGESPRSIQFSGKRLIGCLFVFLRGQWVMAETTLSSDTLLTLETAKEGGRLSADSVE